MDTFQGKTINLININPASITIEDIAMGLSGINRHNGQNGAFYSVAEHSINLARRLKLSRSKKQMYALLHDAHEAYIGDIMPELNRRLYVELDNQEMIPFADFKRIVQQKIYKALGIPEPSAEIEDLIKYEETLLYTDVEKQMFKGKVSGRYSIHEAYASFLSLYTVLEGDCDTK